LNAKATDEVVLSRDAAVILSFTLPDREALISILSLVARVGPARLRLYLRESPRGRFPAPQRFHSRFSPRL